MAQQRREDLSETREKVTLRGSDGENGEVPYIHGAMGTKTSERDDMCELVPARYVHE